MRAACFVVTAFHNRELRKNPRLPTGWTVRGLNPDGGEIFRTCPDRP